jgi:hypothetical protein
MAIVVHGTTKRRAELILAGGPDANFVEPGGKAGAEGFSTYLEKGPFLFGMLEEYARQKAAAFSRKKAALLYSGLMCRRILLRWPATSIFR